MKTHFPIRALLLLIPFLAGICSCEKTYDNPSSSIVNAAVKITVSEITAAEASIAIASEQENITSLVYVPAKKNPGEVNYLSMDAVARLAYIQANGKTVDIPYTIKESNLDPGTSYSVAVIGLDKEGKVRTAPIFATFKSGSAITAVTAEYVGEVSGQYLFKYSMTPNDFVKNYKYLVSNDPAVVKMNAEALKEYIAGGGKGVVTETDPLSVEFKSDVKKDYVVATLSYDELNRPCTLCSEVASTKSVVYFIYNDKKLELTRPDEDKDIFEGTFDVAASCNFTININKEDYGFWSFSGNGGVGQNTSEVTSAPYYYVKPYVEAKKHSDEHFFIRESVGRMQKTAEGGNAFWVAEKAAGKVYVKVDLTSSDFIPRYYVKWVENNPSVVLEEHFDLFSYGAYYMIKYNAKLCTLYPQGGGFKFSSDRTFDGTIPGEKLGGNGTAIATARADWPDAVSEGAELANEAYIKNRGLKDWELRNFCELSGAIAVGNGNFKGRVTTPFLTKLTGATNIKVEFDNVGYGNNTDDFAIHIIGAGKFTSCTASVDNKTTDIAVTSDKKVLLPSGTMMCFVPSGDPDKLYTHITAMVSGADATTRIVFAFDENPVADNKGRTVFDNVKITK